MPRHLPAVDRTCASRECANTYNGASAYCSQRCRNREWRLANNKLLPPPLPHLCAYGHCMNYIFGSPKMYCGPTCNRRQWRDTHQEETRAIWRTYYQNNREKERQRNALHYSEHSEVKRARANAWRVANPEKRNEHRRVRRARMTNPLSIAIRQSDIDARFAYFGNRCWMCGAEGQSVDHVKPLCAGGPHILANLRPACLSCNFRKGRGWKGVAGLETLKLPTAAT